MSRNFWKYYNSLPSLDRAGLCILPFVLLSVSPVSAEEEGLLDDVSTEWADEGYAIDPHLASDSIGARGRADNEVDPTFYVEGLDGLEGSGETQEEYRAYLDQRFVRPGVASAGSTLTPFRVATPLMKGIRVSTETGVGYDSNLLLNGGALGSPAQQNLGNRGGGIAWFRLNTGFSFGQDTSAGTRIIYGINIGGDLISYDSGANARGRGAAEPYLSPYVGVIGAKTTVILSTSYDLSQGSYLPGESFRREDPIAASQTWGFNLSVTRNLNRGTLGYILSYQNINFDTGTFLNDQESIIGDISYMHQPLGMPKTSVGVGIRHGVYKTAANPDNRFIDPSLRVSYLASAKTSFDGRIGYTFEDFDDPGAIGPDGTLSFAFGSNWAITERTRLRVEGYRDFLPSFVAAGQSFDTTGVRGELNYLVPFWRLSASAYLGYEQADYYATLAGAAATNRRDGFVRAGAQIGRPLAIFKRIDTSVSLFYDYVNNDSNDLYSQFDRHFTGIRFSASL